MLLSIEVRSAVRVQHKCSGDRPTTPELSFVSSSLPSDYDENTGVWDVGLMPDGTSELNDYRSSFVLHRPQVKTQSFQILPWFNIDTIQIKAMTLPLLL